MRLLLFVTLSAASLDLMASSYRPNPFSASAFPFAVASLASFVVQDFSMAENASNAPWYCFSFKRLLAAAFFSRHFLPIVNVCSFDVRLAINKAQNRMLSFILHFFIDPGF